MSLLQWFLRFSVGFRLCGYYLMCLWWLIVLSSFVLTHSGARGWQCTASHAPGNETSAASLELVVKALLLSPHLPLLSPFLLHFVCLFFHFLASATYWESYLQLLPRSSPRRCSCVGHVCSVLILCCRLCIGAMHDSLSLLFTFKRVKPCPSLAIPAKPVSRISVDLPLALC